MVDCLQSRHKYTYIKILKVYVYVIIIDQSNQTANLYEIQVLVIYNHAGLVTGKQTGKNTCINKDTKKGHNHEGTKRRRDEEQIRTTKMLHIKPQTCKQKQITATEAPSWNGQFENT